MLSIIVEREAIRHSLSEIISFAEKSFSVGKVIPAWTVPTPDLSLRSALTVIIADESD
jgi:hypothetical protein